MSRPEVAASLDLAERQRSSYRISYDVELPGELTPPEQRRIRERLSDGKGRTRRTTKSPVFDQYGDVSIAVWSAGRSLVLKKSSAVPSQPQMLMIGSGPIKNEQVDDIDVCLGLRFELSPRRPSELVADKKENVIVRRGLGERSGLVDVVFIGPTFGPELCITNVYDPDRGWALVEQRAVLSKDKVVDEAVALDRQRVSARYEMGGWRQSNGVWAPSYNQKLCMTG